MIIYQIYQTFPTLDRDPYHIATVDSMQTAEALITYLHVTNAKEIEENPENYAPVNFHVEEDVIATSVIHYLETLKDKYDS